MAQVERHSSDGDLSPVVFTAALQSERQARILGRLEEGLALRLRLSARAWLTFYSQSCGEIFAAPRRARAIPPPWATTHRPLPIRPALARSRRRSPRRGSPWRK